MIDCSDDSDIVRKLKQPRVYLSVSADVPVRQFSDSDVENEVENEEEIQLVPQVSAVRKQSVEKSNEETVSEVDSSRSRSSLVDKPEGSVSIARDTTFDSAIGCSTSNGCDRVGCSDLTQPNRPLDVSKSKCIQSHLSKERLK